MGQQLTKQIKSKLLENKGEDSKKTMNQLLQIIQNTLEKDKVQEISKKATEIFQTFDTQNVKISQQLFHSTQKTIPPQPITLTVIQSQIVSITKAQSLICQTIVDIMSTRKLYLIRQHFRRLSLQILNLQNAEFYVFHDSGRVEYHDFKENYITQLLQEDPKRKVIQHVLANAAGMVEEVQIINNGTKSNKEIKAVTKTQQPKQTISMNKVSFCHQQTLFIKLFNISPNPQKFCSGQINKQSQKYSILSMFTYLNAKSDVQKKINPKIVQKLIKISMIEIQQESEYDIIRFYCKELLDVLGLYVTESESRIKDLLKNERQKMAAENKEQQTPLIDEKLPLIETIKKLFHHQPQIRQLLINLSLRYQQFRYQLLQRQRMYSKYLCEDNVLFMDFDQQGQLRFLSNNRKNSQYETLLYNLHMTNELCIEKIFEENMALQQHIRKSLNDEVKNKKLYDLQNGLKARVVRNQLNEIERIMVLIQDPPIILSHGTFSSSTLEGVNSSNQKKRKAGSTGSDSVSLGKGSKGSANLIKTLEKQNPGITENGWLNLFIKDHELRRNSSNVMTKKKKTLFAKGEQGPNSTKTISSPLNFQQIQFLQQQDIHSPDTNLLLFQDQFLQPFVKKVFNSTKYFSTLEYNKQHFDNFLFHLHQGYQLHDNSFHNFTHGVNVMHTCFIICQIQGNAEILSPLKVFSTVLSGLCHDVGHTGRTNSFEIASRSKKALTYNDLSPLQNFHVSYSFEILRRPENNFLQSLSLEQYNQLRKDMVSNILYTDIKEHFPLIKKFKTLENKPEEKPLSPEDLRTLTGMIIHTSDFGGSAKQFQICKEWSRRVNLEFIAQYKQQQQLGIAQTPFFKDLEVESIMAKNEMGFLKVIVFPLYEALDDFYKDQGTLHKLRVYAENNIKQWETVHICSQAVTTAEKDNIKEEQKKQN